MPSKEKSNFQFEFYDKIYLTSRVLKRYFTRHLHSRNEAGTTNFEMNLREKYLQIGSRWMLSWCYSAPKGPMSEKVMWGLELIWSLSLSLSVSRGKQWPLTKIFAIRTTMTLSCTLHLFWALLLYLINAIKSPLTILETIPANTRRLSNVTI